MMQKDEEISICKLTLILYTFIHLRKYLRGLGAGKKIFLDERMANGLVGDDTSSSN